MQRREDTAELGGIQRPAKWTMGGWHVILHKEGKEARGSFILGVLKKDFDSGL